MSSIPTRLFFYSVKNEKTPRRCTFFLSYCSVWLRRTRKSKYIEFTELNSIVAIFGRSCERWKSILQHVTKVGMEKKKREELNDSFYVDAFLLHWITPESCLWQKVCFYLSTKWRFLLVFSLKSTRLLFLSLKNRTKSTY